MSTQNIQTTLDIVAVKDVTTYFTSLMPGTYRKVIIINNGVNDDKTTDYDLDIMLYKGTFVSFTPSYRLGTVSDNQELWITDDVKIAYQTSINLGTVLFIEIQPTALGAFAPGDHTALTPSVGMEWSADRKDVKTGTIVRPTTADGFEYIAGNDGETGDTEPSWPAVLAGTVVDQHDDWVVSTAYTVGDTVMDTVPSLFQYECITAGTSHNATEPTWDTTTPAPVAWTARKNYDVDDVVIPATLGTMQYKCITAGRSAYAEPSFTATTGLATIDRPPTWTTAKSVTAGDYIMPTDEANITEVPTFVTAPAANKWYIHWGWTHVAGKARYGGAAVDSLMMMYLTETVTGGAYYKVKFTLSGTGSNADFDIQLGSGATKYEIRNGVDGTYELIFYNDGDPTVNRTRIQFYGQTSGGTFDMDDLYVYKIHDFIYKARNSGTTGNIEPTWPEITGEVVGSWEKGPKTTNGETTLDGSVKWEIFPLDYTVWEAEALTGYTSDVIPIWEALTAYVVDDVVTAVAADGATQYKVTVAGTTGAGEPAWDTTFGNPTVDATVTWVAEANSIIVWKTETLNAITWTCEALGTYATPYNITANASI